MQTPNYADGQFATAALLNTAQSYVTASLKDVAGGLFTPGLLNPSSLSFTFSNSLSVNVIAPAPFRLLTSSGVLASAHGTLSGVNSDVATVNFSSLVPSSGSVTAYIVASTLQIGQNSVAVIGPPIGHPDYNPANAPFSFYTNLQDSIAFAATTTAPDNITYYEVARVNLTAGQTSITSLEYNDVVIARPVQAIQVYAGNPNGNIGGTQGASGVQPSIVWDTADELLWVCTTTGTTTTAAWTACAQLNGLSNQTFLVASATPGTNQAVPINQADERYAAINGSTTQPFSASQLDTGQITSTGNAIITAGGNGQVYLESPTYTASVNLSNSTYVQHYVGDSIPGTSSGFASVNLSTAQTYFAVINGSASEAFNVADAATATEAINLGQAQADFAAINGSASEGFNVANAATATEAINLGQAQADFAAINGTQSATFFANSNSAAAEGDIGAYALDHPSAYLYNSASGWGLNSNGQGGEIISFTRSTGAVQVGAGLPVQIAAGVSGSDAINLGQAQADFAAINGSAAEGFNVASAVTGTQAVNLSQFPFDTNNPGYVRLPNGFILQWGLTNSIGIGTQAQTFVLAFPNACLSVVATDAYSGSAPGQTTFGVNALSKTGFNLGSSGPASTAAAFWWALGY